MITGAARGIGRAIAEKLASAGADLALADLRNEDLAATQRICQSHCRRIIASAVDVSRRGDVSDTFRATSR